MFESGDLITILVLVVLEGLLSADNALVMAVMVLGLPRDQHQKALRYGLIGAFAFRIVATLLATVLIRIVWVKLAGGLYLAYLTMQHFRARGHGEAGHGAGGGTERAFWMMVVRVELMNLAFSIDSILVAVAMSPKIEVVLTGGILGIVAMRLVVGQLLDLIRRYPTLVDGAFVIIGWVAIKLVVEYLHEAHFIAWTIPRWLSLGAIGVIFVASYLVARRRDAPRTVAGGDQSS
jgi:YkoY family integral membrane protein